MVYSLSKLWLLVQMVLAVDYLLPGRILCVFHGHNYLFLLLKRVMRKIYKYFGQFYLKSFAWEGMEKFLYDIKCPVNRNLWVFHPILLLSPINVQYLNHTSVIPRSYLSHIIIYQVSFPILSICWVINHSSLETFFSGLCYWVLNPDKFKTKITGGLQ